MIVSRTPAAKVTDAALHSQNVNDHSDCEQSVLNESDHFLQTQDDPIVDDEYCDESLADDHITDRRPPSLSSSNWTTHQSQSQNSEFGRVKLFTPWFPQVDPNYNRSSGTWSWRIWHSKRHVLLWTAFTGATTVLLINVALLSVLSKKYGTSSTRGLVSFY
jgi:hypothetical protein